MAILNLGLKEIMEDPDVTFTRSPFAPGKIILRKLPFPKGVVPTWLKPYLIKKGECKGVTGKEKYPTRYGEVSIPKAAICVAAAHAKSPEKKEKALARLPRGMF